MQRVGMFEAKTHLPDLIRQVRAGEEICLTNRDQEVAFIISVEQYYQRKNKNIFQEWASLKKSAPLGSVSDILSMRDEGRK